MALTFGKKAVLRQADTALSAGDTIQITYTPDSGTRLLVGDRVVLTDQGDELMRAFLDLWAGRSPVSKNYAALALTRGRVGG